VLGTSLGPAYQLIPELSIAEITVHHLQAKYYYIGVSHVAQLMK
jgi:cobalamin-dependent methionine synthase I